MNSQNSKLIKRLLIYLVEKFWKIPGGIFEIILFLIFLSLFPDFYYKNSLQMLQKELNIISMFIFIPNAVFVYEFLIFTIIFCITLIILFVVGLIPNFRYVLKIPDKILNLKISISWALGGPIYLMIKFILSIFIGIIVKISPFLIFNLTPHEEIKIFQEVRRKIENQFKDDAEKSNWSWFKYDLIRAMTNNRLPKSNGPKWYNRS